MSPARLQSGPNQSNCQNHTPTQSSFEHLQHIGLQVCNIIWQFFPIFQRKFLQRLAKQTQSSTVLLAILCCMSGIQSNWKEHTHAQKHLQYIGLQHNFDNCPHPLSNVQVALFLKLCTFKSKIFQTPIILILIDPSKNLNFSRKNWTLTCATDS